MAIMEVMPVLKEQIEELKEPPGGNGKQKHAQVGLRVSAEKRGAAQFPVKCIHNKSVANPEKKKSIFPQELDAVRPHPCKGPPDGDQR